MSVKSSDTLEDILWKLLKLQCKSKEGGENHASPGFCIEVNVHIG